MAVGRTEERMYLTNELNREILRTPLTMKPASVSAASNAQYLPSLAETSKIKSDGFETFGESPRDVPAWR